MPRLKMEKNLHGFVKKVTRDVSLNSVLYLIEEDRKQKLVMNPSSAFRKKKANSVNEKNNIITNILEDIKDYKIKRRELKDANRKLGTFLITYCSGCREEYELFKNSIYLDNEGNPIEKTWANYFSYQDKDYCCETCEFTTLKLKKNTPEFVDKYNSLYDHRFKTLTEYNTLGIEYRVALEQKQSLLESFEEMIKTHKETVAILIFKKNDIQWHINIIQISVILISCIMTIFETSQKFLEQYVDSQILVIFPIILSSYIGLVLAIGRFFKYDDKNEKIIKLIEKYSFIINKFRQKSDNFENFDFKLKELSKWKVFLDMDEKDNIGDILLKANEEKDLVLTPKELVFYKQKYTKTRLKELMESKNFTELGDLIKSNEYPDIAISQLTQDIILKRNCCKYYFCFMWLCYDRDYVDYDKTVLKNAIFFLKSNDKYNSDKILINNENNTNDTEMNKELRALVDVMQQKLDAIELEKEQEKKINRIKVEEKQKRQKKEIAKSKLKSSRAPVGDRYDESDDESDDDYYRSKRSSWDNHTRRVGDKVEAKVRGWTKYYPGSITRKNPDGTYDIKFNDGERRSGVKESEIKDSLSWDESDDDYRSRRRDRREQERERERERRRHRRDGDDRRSSYSNMREGDRVEAKCTGWTRYFKGEITRVNSDDTYNIRFDDGERKRRVRKDQVRSLDGDRDRDRDRRSSSPSRLRRGDKVEAKVAGWTKYYKGEITRVNSDDTYDIKFDDGERKRGVYKDQIRSLGGKIAFLPNDRVIAKIDGEWRKCIIERVICRGDEEDDMFYNLRDSEKDRDYKKIPGKFVKKENSENLKLVITPVANTNISESKLKLNLREFEKIIWQEVKEEDTLKQALKELYSDITKRGTDMTVKHIILYISDAMDIYPHHRKTFSQYIYNKIKSGNSLSLPDWQKYFKNTFKQRIIDLNKPGFVDDCVIDISNNVIIDISNNVIIDTSGNNSLVEIS